MRQFGFSVFIGFLACLFLYFRYNLLDPRFFEFYFVFGAGVFLSRQKMIFEKIIALPIWIHLLFVCLAGIPYWIYCLKDYEIVSLSYLSTSFLFGMSVIFFAIKIFRHNSINFSIWAPISYGSFFAYLFHRPIWEIMFWYIKFPWDIHGGWYRLIPGSIIVFVVCYYMQAGYDLMLKSGSNWWKHLTARTA